jgi:hypothetical protein
VNTEPELTPFESDMASTLRLLRPVQESLTAFVRKWCSDYPDEYAEAMDALLGAERALRISVELVGSAGLPMTAEERAAELARLEALIAAEADDDD